MTFYWWSHWFWITTISAMLFSFMIVPVQTYPSQEQSSSSTENNHHIRVAAEDNTKKVTKLYQASSTLSWSTTDEPTTTRHSAELFTQRTKLQSITVAAATTSKSKEDRRKKKNLDETDYYYYYDDDDADDDSDDNDHDAANTAELKETEEQTEMNNLKKMEEDFEKNENLKSSQNAENQQKMNNKLSEEEFGDFKRSAESFQNQTESSGNIQIIVTSTSVPPSALEATSNYSNFTTKAASKIERQQTLLNSTQPLLFKIANHTVSLSFNQNVTTHLPPSTPKIIKNPDPLEWLSAITARSLPNANVNSNVGDSLRRYDHSAADYSDDHKIPYTLENVNKAEELRRAENEHQSRKPKGLSAEYKHINRYINYSSDPKNLLTRSATTTVNEYESEESNISSEALSVQRAYYMDVGAISAICFTVFGICCTVGTIGIVLYRRRFLNKPQALSEPDSSVYIDDSTMRDNSDEMYSLDNDSFLNSLEAMTIQNYWTDTVKHTKL